MRSGNRKSCASKKGLGGYEHECIDVFIIVILAILFIYREKVEVTSFVIVIVVFDIHDITKKGGCASVVAHPPRSHF